MPPDEPKLLPLHPPAAGVWSAWFEAAGAHGMALMPWALLFSNPRVLQKRWLDALSQAMDGYLRSAAFLDYVQSGIRAMSTPTHSTRTAAGRSDEILPGDSQP